MQMWRMHCIRWINSMMFSQHLTKFRKSHIVLRDAGGCHDKIMDAISENYDGDNRAVMSIRHILFDLDGTLLPMVQDEFVKFYMPLLAKSYTDAGVSIDPKKFIGAVWAGYEAMVKNDGSRTNREAFWSYIEPELPLPTEESEKIALNFYADEFNQAICTTKPTPVSDQIVKRGERERV